MLQNMDFQIAFSVTSKITKITNEFLCFQVSQLMMLLQITLLLKRFSTVWTFKGSCIGMNQFVISQGVRSFEILIANLTFEVLFVTVSSEMPL
jgi:hypothetical protein